MNNENSKKTCPVEYAGGLDNSFRRFLQNPSKILGPYIRPGMTVLDLGCGPGFFTMEIAKLLGNSGKVIAADLQEGMLEKVRTKIRGTGLEEVIELHKCEAGTTGIKKSVDFVLLFYMIHEVDSQEALLKELKSILNPGGKILIIEPKFHVSKKAFEVMILKTISLGFKVTEGPKVFFSRTVMLSQG